MGTLLKGFVSVIVVFVLACNAASNEMVTFSNENCNNQWYDWNGQQLARADAYGGDCAHFVARSIVAGGCLPGLSLGQNLWTFNSFQDNGVHYNLICVGGPNHCYYNTRPVGGLHEYLRDHGWINTLRHPTDWDAVQYACAVLGNPIGPNRGDWAHSAFGISARQVNAHTSDHCNVDVASIFESLQAVWCPPAQCQSCNCNPCQVCNAGNCVAKCDVGQCQDCDGNGNCHARCAACQTCSGGQCVDNSAQQCPDQCTRCDNDQCVQTDAARDCQQNKCMQCLGGQCVSTAIANQCANDKCSQCNPNTGVCEPVPAKNNCTDKCKQCNPASGTCDMPTATATGCNKCQKCNSGNGQCEDVAAKTNCTDKCTQCNPDTGICDMPTVVSTCDKCLKCNPVSGVCDVPRNLSCVANKCYRCDAANGQCVFNSDIKCNPCQICEPSTGQCIDAGACNKCQRCVPSTNNQSFKCEPIVEKCKSCEWCDGITGQCHAIRCAECSSCDLLLNQCKPTPNITCGVDNECNMCDATGRCMPTPDADCSGSLNASICQLARCQDGRCTLRAKQAAINITECAPGGQCFVQLCQPDGSCKRIAKPQNTSCNEINVDECNVALCNRDGECVSRPLADGIGCTGKPFADRNGTLCQQHVCQQGKCVSVPRDAGTNCTHRLNETDFEEQICIHSFCDGTGMCVANDSLAPLCAVAHRQKHKATAAIIAIIVGASVALVAAAVVAVIALVKNLPTITSGLGMDAAADTMAINPTYVQLADEHTNPTYNG